MYSKKEKLFKLFLKNLAKNFSPKKNRKWQYRFFKGGEILKEVLKMNNALVIYFSNTGNTEKVALAIEKGLKKGGLDVDVKKVNEAEMEDFFDYDLVCFGSPVLHSLPPPPVFNFIKKNEKRYRNSGDVNLSSPPIINKSALVFCTYSGPHCGINEAIPVGKYIRQFFEHLGFDIKDEWYEIGEFHGWDEGSVKGRLGDIRGRPNVEDLSLVELKAAQLARTIYKK